MTQASDIKQHRPLFRFRTPPLLRGRGLSPHPYHYCGPLSVRFTPLSKCRFLPLAPLILLKRSLPARDGEALPSTSDSSLISQYCLLFNRAAVLCERAIC